MRPDPASTLPRALGAPHAGQDEARDTSGLNMASGVYLGVVIGLALWLGVVGLALAVSWLA